MATVDGIGLAEPSTITKSLAAVSLTRNSSVTYQEIMVIGDPDSTTSSAIAKVINSTPASTAWGLVVRDPGVSTGPIQISSVVGVVATAPMSTVWASSAGFHFNSSGALSVDITGGASTIVTVARTVGNSSAADFMPVRLVDSSGTGFLTPGNEYTDGSTYSSLAGPTLTFNNSSNNTFRVVASSSPLPVQPLKGSYSFTSGYSTVVSTASSAFYQLISSAAGLSKCVYAYSVTSTAVAACLIEFVQSTVTTVWHTEVGSQSSGVTGANMAVAPPGRLFQSSVAGNINVRLGSTGVEVKISLASFTE